MEKKELYKKAIDLWGVDLHALMVIEEMAELTKALTKWLIQRDVKSKEK